MGYQIIKQDPRPEDTETLYCVWSSGVDQIIIFDATRQEISDWDRDLAIERAARSLEIEMTMRIDKGIVVSPFGKSFDEVKDEVAEGRRAYAAGEWD